VISARAEKSGKKIVPAESAGLPKLRKFGNADDNSSELTAL